MNGLDRMQAAMVAYFSAEKQESLLFVLVGVAAIAASAYLLARRHRLRAMAYPLIAIALIQIAVGGSVYLRTDEQVATLQAQLALAPAAYRAEELARMDKVSAGFRLYKGIEIALIVAGAVMIAGFRRRQALLAAGIGLVLQASIMLVLDLFAERRAEHYIEAIRQLPAAIVN